MNEMNMNNFIRGMLAKKDLETTIKILLPIIFEKAEFKSKESFLELVEKYYKIYGKQ